MRGGRDMAAIALLKAAASALVLAGGFRAVSDDDFARVVIAEQWAHAPRLDPSGTSWLPAPFWVTGAALLGLGRSLVVARAVALLLGVGAALVVYVAARWITADRAAALAGAALAAVFPWSARLGAATVPELPAAALTLLAMASLVPPLEEDPRAARRPLWGALALLFATLSRYEGWPVAAAFALICLAGAKGRGRAASLSAGLIALAGPLAWIGWNRIAHGDPWHFVARVAAYRKALGGAEPGGLARLTAYPAAMFREEPELFAVLLLALIACAIARTPGYRDRLRRFAWPAALTLLQIAALSFAMVKDGAPTHHPERAVLVAFLLAAVAAGDLAVSFARAASARGRMLGGIGAVIIAGLIAALIRPRLPREGFAQRDDEVAIGRAAGAMMPVGARALVEVVDYGHLAVVAAIGRPEDAVLDRSIDPRDTPVRSSFEDPSALTARVAAAQAAYVIGRPSPVTAQALGEPATARGGLAIWPAPTRPTGGAP